MDQVFGLAVIATDKTTIECMKITFINLLITMLLTLISSSAKADEVCSSQRDYDFGVKHGLKMAPPCLKQKKETANKNAIGNSLKKIGWIDSKSYSCNLINSLQGSKDNLKSVAVDYNHPSSTVDVKILNGLISTRWKNEYNPPSGSKHSLSGYKYKLADNESVSFEKAQPYYSIAELKWNEKINLMQITTVAEKNNFLMIDAYACK